MTQVRSVCPYCGVGCGLLVEVERSRITAVRGDPAHPSNAGRLCGKGLRLAETVRTGDRLVEPMARPWTGERFDRARPPAPVSWEEAVDHLARGIRRALADGGPDSVALYLSGQLLTEDYYAANKLAKGLIGTANVDTNSRLCMASTVAAYKRAFGADGPPGCYADLEAASDVVLWGSNARVTHPVLFDRLQAARREGVHWTVVDPRRTPTAEAADLHLAIRPGADVALTLAMCAALFEEGLVDDARVRATCSGLDEMRAAAARMPPERAAGLCGVAASEIRALARRLATSAGALSLWCQGFNQSTAGTDKVSSLINFHLLSGQVGRPGAGPFSLTGQSNAMGGREVGGVATELAAHRELDDAAGRAAVERHWGLGPVPARRGLTASELTAAIERGRVRVLWVVCTNPAASLPDGWAVRAALRRLDLLVVQEITHPTDTTVFADVLLPAAGWGEKTGTMTSSERRVSLVEAAVPPPGRARPDWEIFAAVGRALGGGAAFAWGDAAAVFAEHVALTAGADLDMTALSHDLLRRQGPQQWPYPKGGLSQARRYAGGRCATPDGRARLVAVAYREPAEQPGPDHPLRLTSARERDQWHTMSRTGRVSALASEGRAVIQVHPEDARAAGVEDGDRVLVSSPRGSMRAWARIDGGARPGCAWVSFHRGPLLEPEGWANVLFGAALDETSFQPELKHTVVRVTPLADRFAVAGGELAARVAAALRRRGHEARLVGRAELAGVGDAATRRVLVAAGATPPGVLPWWRAAGRRWPPGGGRRAVFDLRQGPEALAALPALAAAGWVTRRLGDGGLPAPVLRAAGAALAPLEAGAAADLVVGAPAPAPPGACPPAGTLVLEPGRRLGLGGPLTGDPERLADLVADGGGPASSARRVAVPLDPGRSLLVIGETSGPDADLLAHEDQRAGTAQVWRLAGGRLLGVAAVVRPAAMAGVEALWLAQAPPAVLRRRFPVG